MLAQLLQRQLSKGPALGHQGAHDPADGLVRLTEGDTAAGEMVREVGGGEHPHLRGGTHPVAIDAHATYH